MDGKQNLRMLSIINFIIHVSIFVVQWEKVDDDIWNLLLFCVVLIKHFNFEMHTIGEVSRNVPAFLGKLWKMVEDPETDDFITWNSVSHYITNFWNYSIKHAFEDLLTVFVV